MRKLFISDKFFLAATIFAAIGSIVSAATCFFGFGSDMGTQMILLFRVICAIVLYISYQKHSKNVMKGMMGAMLAAQLITAVLYLPGMENTPDHVCTLLFAVLSALLFINHFVINSEHTSNPGMIKVNQILVVLLVINTIVWAVSWRFINPTPLGLVVSVFDTLGFIGLSSVVVCVESRLDAYRLDREAGGWTEGKGYPEGYVHEYEKKEK